MPQAIQQDLKHHFMKRYFFVFSLLIARIATNALPVSHFENGTSFTVQMSRADQYSAFQDDGIKGSWSLELQAFDKNNNGKLDEQERKDGTIGRHFYQFNGDGTCLIHTLKLKGHYELKKVGGKQRLYTYIDEDGSSTPENKWYIISVSQTEMILLSQDKYAFWIYKRV